MIEQQKILRILKLITLLKQPHRRTPQEIASILDCSDKSIYRYFKLLEELGFMIEKDSNARYFIKVQDKNEDDWAFSAEEGVLMRQVVNNTLKKHPLRNTILEKIQIKSEAMHVGNQLYKARLGKIMSQLTEAIDAQKQVMLRSYMSANSETISDRLIEPFAFSENQQHVIAWEVGSQTIKHFKIERIGSVVMTEKKQKNKDHHLPVTDIFGMTEEEPEKVKISMTLRAMLLLKEEFPNAEGFITKSGSEYVLECPVNGYRGIGRFIMSVLAEVTSIDHPGLKGYIKKLLTSGQRLTE